MKQSGFDRIAEIYDPLARLFFGGKIKKAQTCHLHLLEPNAEVLILGGGTGWIAKEILKIIPSAKITFMDSSKRMIELATQKAKGQKVEFIHGTEESVPQRKYDAIITPFYLDMFPQKKLEQIVNTLSGKLESDGIWFATDFISETGWHKIYLRAMYSFFRITSDIEARKLPDWRKPLAENDLKLQSEARYYRGFIVAQARRRET